MADQRHIVHHCLNLLANVTINASLQFRKDYSLGVSECWGLVPFQKLRLYEQWQYIQLNSLFHICHLISE